MTSFLLILGVIAVVVIIIAIFCARKGISFKDLLSSNTPPVTDTPGVAAVRAARAPQKVAPKIVKKTMAVKKPIKKTSKK